MSIGLESQGDLFEDTKELVLPGAHASGFIHGSPAERRRIAAAFENAGVSKQRVKLLVRKLRGIAAHDLDKILRRVDDAWRENQKPEDPVDYTMQSQH